MNSQKVHEAMKCAREFVKSCEAVLKEEQTYEYIYMCGCPKTGDLKRRSMDLTRKLAKLRKSD